MTAQLRIGDPCPGGDARSPTNHAEAFARDMLQELIEGDLYLIDDPPDMVLCKRCVVAGWVEVTRATDSAMRALHDRLGREERTFETDRLRHSWLVALDPAGKLKDLDRDRLVDALSLKESVEDLEIGQENRSCASAPH